MYYYVYDEFVQDPKFERELALIETRVTDLGIAGKIARLALFRDAAELIRDEVRKGANTIVAVGNDLTLRKVIDASAESGVALAVIPLGNGTTNRIADILGVTSGVTACDILSARIIEELDVGLINGKRFINSVQMTPTSAVEIECDQKFKMSPLRRGTIEIRNLALSDESVRAANPTDGKLEIVIRAPERSWFGKKRTSVSVVPVKQATIKSEQPMTLTVDGEPFEAKELLIKALPGQLRMITGKGRKF
ncbi:MAG: diacylglycerol kinase family protein [Patescibacteria group bacterium]